MPPTNLQLTLHNVGQRIAFRQCQLNCSGINTVLSNFLRQKIAII